MRLWPQRVCIPTSHCSNLFLCLVKQSGGCLGIEPRPKLKLYPMKMNGSLLLTFVFKPSGVQHEADGFQTEKEIHHWCACTRE